MDFEVFGFCNNESNVIPEHFVKVASRPNLSIEETEVNHLNGKMWIPGKASWETITVTYLDVAHGEMQQLWNWLATMYDFTDPIGLKQGTRRDWDATGVLNMYDVVVHCLNNGKCSICGLLQLTSEIWITHLLKKRQLS